MMQSADTYVHKGVAAPGDAETTDAALRRVLGEGAVRDDPALRGLVSEDIWSRAPVTSARVVAPRDTHEVAAALSLLSAEGRPLAVRGGGMSYTGGYTPRSADTTTLDLRRMDRVLAVNAEAMTVTVQAGCTWRTLWETLRPLGLRTPFWGPLSGLASTVGGAMAQEAALFGSARHGSAGGAVLALTVVLADGRILKTGARGRDGAAPFFRGYGPDVTGLFCGDCGALGVKAEIVLRLVRTPAFTAHASFTFSSRAACVAAVAEIARAEVAAEVIAFDPALGRARLKRVGARAAIRSLAEVEGAAGSVRGGAATAARLALSGPPRIGAEDHSLHLTCEGRSQAAVDADLDQARMIAGRSAGREIPNTVPTVLRANPFRPLNGVLGAGGERWAPVHGLVSLAEAQAACADLEAMLKGREDSFAAHGIDAGVMLSVVSTHAFLIEAVFTWPDARSAIHAEAVEPDVLARLPTLPENPAAREVVAQARLEVIATLGRHGAAHMQIGRTYPYRESLDAASLALLDAIKATLDPNNRLNIGVLGFEERTPHTLS